MNKTEEQLTDWIKKSLQPMGEVTSHAMMDGQTLYCDGILFAFLDKGIIWFKSDDESDMVWDAAGSDSLTSTRKDGTVIHQHYRSAPEDVYEDAKAMRKWAKQGIAAGRRAKGK
jgi:DNA transformation protein